MKRVLSFPRIILNLVKYSPFLSHAPLLPKHQLQNLNENLLHRISQSQLIHLFRPTYTFVQIIIIIILKSFETSKLIITATTTHRPSKINYT